MKRSIREKLLYIARFAIGIGLVIWILHLVDLREFLEYYTLLSAGTILLIVLLGLISLNIQFRRWKYLVGRNSSDFAPSDLLPSFLAGFAFRLMIPGGQAEFGKVFLLRGKKRGKFVAFGMEKLSLTYIKLLLIVSVLPITFPQYTVYCVAALLILVVLFIVLPRTPMLHKLQEKQVDNYRVLAKTFIYSMVIFAVMVLQYYLLLNQVSQISMAATAHTAIYLWGAGIIPISISGLGVREGLAVFFLDGYGINAAHAVATSLFLFTLNSIIPALIGAYIISRKRANLKEMSALVQSAREIITKKSASRT